MKNLKINKKRQLFLDIIREIAEELNLQYKTLSEGWIISLKNSSKKGYIYLYGFGINEDSSAKICSDKFATYLILRENNIPVVEHKLIYTQILYYKNDTSGNWKKILDFFYKHEKIVIKPNKGSSGKNIYFVENETQLEKAVYELLSDSTQIVLTPYYEIKYEYRVVVLDGQVELIFRKKIPFIEGDGKTPLYELLQKYDINNPAIYKNLLERNIKLSEILPEGKKLFLLKQHNLTGGADAEILNKFPEAEKIALKTADALNIKFASIDIIESYSGDLRVIEVNSGVTLVNFAMKGNRQKVKNIYKKAIQKWLID